MTQNGGASTSAFPQSEVASSNEPTSAPTVTLTQITTTLTQTAAAATNTSQNGAAAPDGSGTSTENKLSTPSTVLIVIACIVVVLFAASFTVFCVQEWSRAGTETGTETGAGTGNRGAAPRRPSYARAAGRALAVATGLFVPIWAFRKVRDRRRGAEAGESEGQKGGEKLQEETGASRVVYFGDLRDVRGYGNPRDLGDGREVRDFGDYGGAMDFRDVRGPARSPIGGNGGATYLGVRDVRGGDARAGLAPRWTPPPPNGGASVVSSLSSTTEGSRGRYDRIRRSPSPLTEEASEVSWGWDPPYMPPSAMVGGLGYMGSGAAAYGPGPDRGGQVRHDGFG
ncbi:hypothetical protein GGR52DRAFT_575791 [Hypoxylon sp. FL1284]|nr:hypothetical protein GGR52DRAFT_575791 [Hypoxylon sp. FL1284]